MLMLSAFAVTLFAAAANAYDWNENNCRALCTGIYGASGARACISRNNCSQYRGKKSATKVEMRRRLQNYCAGHDCPGQR
jgi:hypothetical protein